MVIGCACGGIIELLVFGIAIFSPGVSAWATKIYNNRMKRKCECAKKASVQILD